MSKIEMIKLNTAKIVQTQVNSFWIAAEQVDGVTLFGQCG
jgi:hypothetical protein